jgi:xanthine dehydrogenase YagR molybdenum-binding subunit
VHADMPEFDIAMIDEDDPHLPGSVNGIGMLGTAGIKARHRQRGLPAIGKRMRSGNCRFRSKMHHTVSPNL